MEALRTESNVRGIALCNGKLAKGYTNGDLYIGDNFIMKDVDTALPSLKMHGKHLVVDSGGTCYCYDTENGALIDTGTCIPIELTWSESDFFCIYDAAFDGTRVSWSVGRYNFMSKKLEQDFPALKNASVVFRFENGDVISATPITTKRYSTKNSGDVWNADLSAYGKLVKFLGAKGNFSWFACEKGLIGLNASTGKMESSINPDLVNLHTCMFYEDRIISLKTDYPRLNASYFLEIDAATGNILRSVEITDLEEKGFVFAKEFTVRDNKLFLTVREKNILFGVGVAILSLSDLKTLHAFKVKNRKGYITYAPVLINNELSVLDTAATLHTYVLEDLQT